VAPAGATYADNPGAGSVALSFTPTDCSTTTTTSATPATPAAMAVSTTPAFTG